jgi:hypothetical protein
LEAVGISVSALARSVVSVMVPNRRMPSLFERLEVLFDPELHDL